MCFRGKGGGAQAAPCHPPCWEQRCDAASPQLTWQLWGRSFQPLLCELFLWHRTLNHPAVTKTRRNMGRMSSTLSQLEEERRELDVPRLFFCIPVCLSEIPTTPSLAISCTKQVQNTNSSSKLPVKLNHNWRVASWKPKNLFSQKEKKTFAKNNPTQFLLQVFIHSSPLVQPYEEIFFSINFVKPQKRCRGRDGYGFLSCSTCRNTVADSVTFPLEEKW